MRVLMLQGASRGQVVRGKLLALGTVALLVGLPAMIGFLAIAGQPGALALPMVVIALGYAAYLALWVVLIVLVSALVRRSRDALLALVALWAVAVVLLAPLVFDSVPAGIKKARPVTAGVAVLAVVLLVIEWTSVH